MLSHTFSVWSQFYFDLNAHWSTVAVERWDLGDERVGGKAERKRKRHVTFLI